MKKFILQRKSDDTFAEFHENGNLSGFILYKDKATRFDSKEDAELKIKTIARKYAVRGVSTLEIEVQVELVPTEVVV